MSSTPGKPYVKKDNKATGDVSGVLGLAGEQTGSFAVSFSESCIIKVVSNMLGEEITALNKDVEDAVGEITNMISGGARKELGDNGFHFEMALPTVVVGKNHSITHVGSNNTIVIPFTTEAGPYAVEVSFAEG
jgi:chemotaxis protein CheX